MRAKEDEMKGAELIKRAKDFESRHGCGSIGGCVICLADFAADVLADIAATLRKCETAIDSLPSDALGIGGDAKFDSTRWYRRDELLSEIREVLDGKGN